MDSETLTVPLGIEHLYPDQRQDPLPRRQAWHGL